MGKKAVFCDSALFLVAASLWARPFPVGTVSSCRAATVRGTALIPGATIFSDDIIEVGPGGSAWIAARSGGQVEVFENSTVILGSTERFTELTVSRGLAKSNSKAITIRNISGSNVTSHPRPETQRGIQGVKDCEVSKSTSGVSPCHDDTD